MKRNQTMSTTTMIAETVSSSSSNVVNGIDTDAVHTLIDEVDGDPAKGMTHWRVASSWQGGTHSRAQVDGFVMGGANVPRRFAIDMDEPFEIGGGNAYANPQEYLLAAMNACMIVSAVDRAAARHLSSQLRSGLPKGCRFRLPAGATPEQAKTMRRATNATGVFAAPSQSCERPIDLNRCDEKPPSRWHAPTEHETGSPLPSKL
jgi:hypothetical protein